MSSSVVYLGQRFTSLRATLPLTVALLLLLVAPSGWAQANSQGTDAGFWYLLVHRVERPEKNYYELTRKALFAERELYSEELVRQYKPSPRHSGADIITDSTIRYGVYQAWKVRVIGTSDSQRTPISVKDSAYVLIYSRNPDWKF